MKWDLPIVAGALLAVAGVSRRLTATPFTPAMAFVLIGLLVGPFVRDKVTVSPASETVRTLAEATLAVVLFADASRIKLRVLRQEYEVPLRLLAIGLPLTIAIGALLAAAMFAHLNAAEAVALAVVLAPTDAALGQAVVTEPRLPSRIRQGLNVESGLNDGICVPLLLIALAVADVEAKTTTSHHAVSIVAEEIGYGILGGVAAGLAGGRRRGRDRPPPEPDQRIVAPGHAGRRRGPRLRFRGGTRRLGVHRGLPRRGHLWRSPPRSPRRPHA
jgi:sodium/hydrogen antiporter